MTTQLAFILGMLSIVSIAMLIGTVWSLLGVYTLEAKVKDLKSNTNSTFGETARATEEIRRDLSMTINETGQNAHTRMDSLYEDLDRKVHELYRHIDSRFDKFENRVTAQKEKQLLKS